MCGGLTGGRVRDSARASRRLPRRRGARRSMPPARSTSTSSSAIGRAASLRLLLFDRVPEREALASLRGDMARLHDRARRGCQRAGGSHRRALRNDGRADQGRFGEPADLEEQRRFFDAHIGCWAPRFFEDLQAAPNRPCFICRSARLAGCSWRSKARHSPWRPSAVRAAVQGRRSGKRRPL